MEFKERKEEIVNHIFNLKELLGTLNTDLFSQNQQAHNISDAIMYLNAELCEIVSIELDLNQTKKAA